ncbi:hypothetical protein [Nocardioides humi]|uniref:hypothetical protein n=1 Tax=Nocardioides humi TaxID=449461 RepID=UPI0015E836C6|nr:hypothetical protein [Nocardioides humi]
MTEPVRPHFSLRELLAQIRRSLPWSGPREPEPREPDVDAERLRVQVGVIRRAFEDDVAAARRRGPGHHATMPTSPTSTGPATPWCATARTSSG